MGRVRRNGLLDASQALIIQTIMGRTKIVDSQQVATRNHNLHQRLRRIHLGLCLRLVLAHAHGNRILARTTGLYVAMAQFAM